jgi:hypothetical protein
VAIDWIPEAYCVDADGAPLTTDQRREPRPEAGGTMCDLGAFEVQPQPRTRCAATPQTQKLRRGSAKTEVVTKRELARLMQRLRYRCAGSSCWLL